MPIVLLFTHFNFRDTWPRLLSSGSHFSAITSWFDDSILSSARRKFRSASSKLRQKSNKL